MKTIRLADKEFRLLINSSEIDKAIGNIAENINRQFKDEKPLFLSILNGAFMFTSDLLKLITIPGTEVCFLKIASYTGTHSTGEIKELIGMNQDITGRTVIILEDIIDSGKSMEHLINLLKQKNPGKIIVTTMLYKPKAVTNPIQIDYYGIELDNDFIIGRGLDYNGLGRNLPDLYILNEPRN